ncbi:caspase family protein [Arthrobacter sp. DNA4]|uniref:caspase family protein n=1 Tax=Arthrobacter sp. DNA4 TaxID=2963432 RepID=UPI0020CE081A|nr:caspase family protein [Arthrobacter sp. DNA4]UTT71292.1 caspase family protein [Arthrobacter sp. DNA4]
MTKRAVIVGINDYSQQPATKYFMWPNLGGCLADASSLDGLLRGAFGFDSTVLLTDSQASGEAIMAAVGEMLTASGAGDVATFCYAGHGGRLPSNPDDYNDPANYRFYDCIVPYSGDYITDKDLYRLVSSLEPSTVNFTLIMDCCHSGGLSQISPDGRLRSGDYTSNLIDMCVNLMNTVIPCGVVLPPEATGMDGNVSNVAGDGNGVVCSVDDNKSFVPQSKATVLAACRYDEVDADSVGAEGHGGLTAALLDCINATNQQTSYWELVDALRDDMLNILNLQQTPTLLGQENRMDQVFLAAWDDSM